MDGSCEKKILEIFKYQDINLKPLAANDLEYTLQWRNEYREWFNDSNPVLLEQHKNWFLNYQQKKDDFVFIVLDNENNRVGQAAVYNIDWQEKKGEFGRFLVNPNFAGKSYMKTSCQAMLKLCFEELNLKTLYLQVKPHNEKAIHIYKSAGFILNSELKDGNLIMTYDF